MPYQCNCGKIFDSPMERTAHIASCPTMTESKEYQEAVKLTAKTLEDMWFNDSVRNYEKIARELLKQTYPCLNQRCKNGQITYYEKELCGDERLGWVDCPDCKGTGRGGKVLAVRAKNQKYAGIPLDFVKVIEE